MAEIKHTPEPWKLNEHEDAIFAGPDENACNDWIISADGNWPISGATDQEKEDLKRIVACVNACAGIEHPEQFVANALQNAGRLLELSNECDVLKSDLRDILEAFETLVLSLPVAHTTQQMINVIAQVRKENNL